MKKLIATGTALAASATAVLLNTTTEAMACTGIMCPPATNVPEIDALAGTAALATLGASVALVWERRRRNK